MALVNFHISKFSTNIALLAVLLISEVRTIPLEKPDVLVIGMSSGANRSGPVKYAKPPSVPTGPLDVNDNLHHVLDVVNSILGSAGGATGGLVMGLTGISITDCGLSIKEEDLTTISCAQFIDKLSECDSLVNVKPLLQQAKEKYKKKPNSKAPCFAKRGKKGQRRS